MKHEERHPHRQQPTANVAKPLPSREAPRKPTTAAQRAFVQHAARSQKNRPTTYGGWIG